LLLKTPKFRENTYKLHRFGLAENTYKLHRFGLAENTYKV